MDQPQHLVGRVYGVRKQKHWEEEEDRSFLSRDESMKRQVSKDNPLRIEGELGTITPEAARLLALIVWNSALEEVRNLAAAESSTATEEGKRKKAGRRQKTK
jgi:hypothetical protein